MIITPAVARDRLAIEHLLDAAFGPDRFTRTAYKLRHGVAPFGALSMVARDRGALVGSVQYWPVELAGDEGEVHALTLLGPIAVAPDRQGEGIGARLMRSSLGLADALGHDAIVLIGDPDYYVRFGFDSTPTQGWRLPGSFERHRLLLRGDRPLPAQAELRAPSPVPAWTRLPLPIKPVAVEALAA